MVAIADLNLVGAVGIRVRPDATGFRRETKAEVMSQLKGLEGDVPITPEVEGKRSELEAAIRRLTQGLDTTAKVKVKLDSDAAMREAERVERALANFDDVRVNVRANTSSATRAITEMTEKVNNLRDEYDSLNQSNLDNVRSSTERLTGVNKELIKQIREVSTSEQKLQKLRESSVSTSTRDAKQREAALERLTRAAGALREAEEALAEARRRADDTGTAKAIRDAERAAERLAKAREAQVKAEERLAQVNARVERNIADAEAKRQRSIKKTTELLEDQKAKLSTLWGEEIVISSELARQREELNSTQREYSRLIAKANAGLEARRGLFELQIREEERRLRIAEQIAAIEVSSTDQLREMLEAQAREGQTLSDVFDDILWRANRLNDVHFKDLREFVANDFTKSSVAHLRVEAETAMAEAELARLERDRWVRLRVRIDSKVANLRRALAQIGEVKLPKGIQAQVNEWTSAFEGFIKATSGMSSISMMNDMLKIGMKNMHGLALSTSALTVALGTLSALAFSSLGGIASLGKGLIDITKGAVMLPSMLTALGMAFFTAKRGLMDFINAARGDEDAMALLAEHSESLAESAGKLFQVFSEADKSGKGAFFAEVDAQASRLGDTLAPMASLWESAYRASGKFFSGVAEGLNTWFDSGDMSKSVAHMASALDEASGSGKYFTQILTDMTTVGSRYLPGMGKALTDMAARWADFIRVSRNNGDMDRWIVEAGRQLEGLGSTVKGTIGIIDSLGRAAKSAGYDGFVSLGNMMESAAAKLDTPLWQTGLSNIFKGAADGSKLFGAGLRDLADRAMQASNPLSELMRESGRASGKLLELTGNALTNSRALDGITESGRDINQALSEAGGLFVSLGHVMGDSSRVAGELFRSFMKVAEAVATFWADSNELTKGLEAVIPVLGEFAVGLVNLTHGILSPVIDGLGYLLQAFGNMPSAVQQGVIAVGLLSGALLLLKSRANGGILSGFVNSIPLAGRAIQAGVTGLELYGKAVTRATDSGRTFKDSWLVMTGAIAKDGNLNTAVNKVKDLDGRMARMGGGFGLAVGSISAGFGVIRGSADETRRATERVRDGLGMMGRGVALGGITAAKGALTGLKGALTGALTVLGGPWGLAFMAAAAIIGHFTAKAAEAKQKVNDIQGTLSATGETTAQTAKSITDNLNGVWDNFSVGWNSSILNWSKRIGEVAEATGKTSAELAKGIAEGSSEFETYRKNLENAAQVTTAFSGSSDVARGAMATLTEEQKALGRELGLNGKLTAEQAEALGLTADAAGLSGQELQGLVDAINAEIEATNKAKDRQREYAEAMGLTSVEGQKLSAALGTLGDATADTSSKAKAHAEILDVMSGGTRAFLNSTQSQAQAMGSLSDAFKQVREAGIDGSQVFTEYTNALGETSARINTARSDFASLDSAIQSSFDATTNHAQAVYDATLKQTGSMEKAASAANDVMSQWRSQAQAELVALGADARQAEQYLNDIAGEPYMAEVIFMGKTEQFMRARELVESSGRKFDGEAFVAFLKANPGTTLEDIDALVKAGVTWSNGVYAARLAADGSDAKQALDEITERGQSFDQSEFEAVLKGDEQPLLDSVIAARRAGEDVNGTTWTASFEADSAKLEVAAKAAIREGEEFGSRPWIARMDMENTGFAEKFYAAEADMKGLTGEDWWVYVQSNLAEIASEQETLYGDLKTLSGTTAEVTVISNAMAEAMALEAYKMVLQGMDGQTIQQKLKLSDDEWVAVVDAMPGRHDELKSHIEGNPVNLRAQDDTETGLSGARANLDAFSLSRYAAKATVDTDEVESALAAASQLGATFGLSTFAATADANNAPALAKVDAARTQGVAYGDAKFSSSLDADNTNVGISIRAARLSGEGFSNTSYLANLGANHGGVGIAVGIARAIGNSFGALSFISKLSGDQGPMAANTLGARGIGNAFRATSFISTLSGNSAPMAAQTSGARGIGNAFRATVFTSTLSGNASPFSGTLGYARSLGHGFSWSNFRSTLSAADAASGTINYLFGRGWAWAGRVFTATFRAVTQALGLANGGILQNGVQVFANGGFIPQASVRRFAGGGVTSGRHAPQIRYPQGPNVTVWNEGAGRGNTGGESYIPHAIGKRSRSTQILGLTAREFGLSVVKYGDGGITHIGGQDVPATMGMSAPQASISPSAIVRGVQGGLAGAQLTIGRNGDVSFALAAERGRQRNNRR